MQYRDAKWTDGFGMDGSLGGIKYSTLRCFKKHDLKTTPEQKQCLLEGTGIGKEPELKVAQRLTEARQLKRTGHCSSK